MRKLRAKVIPLLTFNMGVLLGMEVNPKWMIVYVIFVVATLTMWDTNKEGAK